MARILVYEAIDIDNFDNIRRRLTSPSKTSFRSSSISSTTFSILYHKKIEINNNLLDKKFTEPVNSSQLSYISNHKVRVQIAKTLIRVNQMILSIFNYYITLTNL